jgi:hypothetical protein
VAAELVHTSVELAARDLELAQLRQALTSRVWIEQAKGVLAATQGLSPDEAFGQLRRRARATSRKLAELAQEVVQGAQTDLTQRRTALDQAQVAADERDRVADQRERAADERDRAADDRDRLADEREHAADERDRAAGHPGPP